jgi:hypothetical protein
MPHVFPPELVKPLRDRLAAKGTDGGDLRDVSDALLVHLLTTVFFSGLDTYEGERNPVRVVFLGRKRPDPVVPQASAPGSALDYEWRLQYFGMPRPFIVPELVKLAVAGAGNRLYSAVLAEGERLSIAALARQGRAVADPFVEIVAPAPGCLSVRKGQDRLLEYERGGILPSVEGVAFSTGRIRHALESIARAAGLGDSVVPDYVDTVRAVIRRMAAHGRGGILVLSAAKGAREAEAATYRMQGATSLSSVLRLSRHLAGGDDSRRSAAPPTFGELLRNAFQVETGRFVEEVGALTGIDGAVLLNRELELMAFGVTLPVGRSPHVVEANNEANHRSVEFGARGTRHRAAATYAADHSGSVVFVASTDGHISGLMRDASEDRVLLWRLGPADTRP